MENTKRCAACGCDVPVNAKFCSNCGSTQFSSTLVQCPVCGATVPLGQYCAHCGTDLRNPGAQVWRNCTRCGNPVHITHTHCSRCGAACQVQTKSRQPKRRSAAWLLLLIPLLCLLVGIGIGVVEYLENELPQLNFPGTTAQPQNPSNTIPRPTFGKPEQPATKATEPTKPTQAPTQPPTEPETIPIEPTEPPTEPESNIPDEFAENYYLSCMDTGYCEAMTGDMVVIFLFVSDPTSGWTDTEIADAETALVEQLRYLQAEALSYGAQLDIRYLSGSATIDQEFSRYSQTWKQEAMTNVGLYSGYKNQRELEAQYEADNVPVVFLVNEEGRSYANTSASGNVFESLTILEKDYNALRHELCHLFGAEDMYFPQQTVEAAKTYLPNGIMFGDCEGNVDALTAFVMGWTEELTQEATAFLLATNAITEEDVEQARQQDQLTGFGTKYFDGGSYTGMMIGGVFHGQGTCYWDDGTVYTGTWLNGVRDGYGEYTAPSGYSYQGYWRDGKKQGKGTETYASGDTYVGDFANGERHGQGTYTWTDGTVYTGAWVNDERTGYATAQFADGSAYEGNWLNGVFSGYGEYSNQQGFSYKGHWKDGQYHGTGTQTWANGESYTGDFVAGKRHGKGTYTWANGDYYIGDFVDGQRTGKGEQYYSKYGTKYVGDFVNGKRQGWGTYYYADGTTYTGRWENDVRVD